MSELVEAGPAALESAADNGLGERLRRFVDLSRQRKALEEELDGVRAQMAALETPLLEDMALNGMQNANVDGLCVYRRTDYYPGRKEGVTSEQVVDALLNCGLDKLATANWQSLRGYLTECREEGKLVPSALTDVIEVREAHKLMTRKA